MTAIIAAVVMLIFGLQELSYQKSRNHGTCGRVSNVETNATSAKKVQGKPVDYDDSDNVGTDQYQGLEEEWMNSDDNCDNAYVGQPQDDKALSEHFGDWIASEEDSAKFSAISKQTILTQASKRHIPSMSAVETPTGARYLGSAGGPLSILKHGTGQAETKIDCNNTIPPWGGSDAYHMTRQQKMKESCDNVD